MTAGRKPKDADLVRVDLELGSPRAHGANGALGVIERRRMLIAGALVTILEHEGRHAMLVEPLADFDAFVAHGQPAISAAGTNDTAAPVALSPAAN